MPGYDIHADPDFTRGRLNTLNHTHSVLVGFSIKISFSNQNLNLPHSDAILTKPQELL